jgi:hypothetical protein
MLTVSVSGGPRPNRDNHVWLEPPHDANDILQDRIGKPLGGRFFHRTRIPEVEGSREELFGAVDTAGLFEFACSEKTEPYSQLLPD